MELRIIESKNHTIIKVKLRHYAFWKRQIDEYIKRFGGEEAKRSNQFVWFEIYADLINMPKKTNPCEGCSVEKYAPDDSCLICERYKAACEYHAYNKAGDKHE